MGTFFLYTLLLHLSQYNTKTTTSNKNLNKFLSDKDAWLVILYWLSIQFEDDTDWNELTRTSIEQLGNNLKPDDLAKGLSYLNGELTTVNIRYW